MSYRDIILKHCSKVDSARDAIDRYFYREMYTGSKFEIVADRDNPNQFTARDIVAVSMLAINIPPTVSFWLLHSEEASQMSDLLRQVPTDLDIWDASEHLSGNMPLAQLRDFLLAQKDIGPTTCSKLLAAKRSRLVPIMDSFVVKVLGHSNDYWRDFREAVSSPHDRAIIEIATANAPPYISLIRRIDVVIWMHYRDIIRGL
jgi:hypothetical protein